MHKSPLRILVVANLPPFVLGGAENQVALLVENWSLQGHHVEVAGHRIPSGMHGVGQVRIRMHGIRVIHGFGRPGRALSYFFAISLLLRRIQKNFDIIYCRGLGDAAVSICLLKEIGWVALPMISTPINAKGFGDAHFVRSIPGHAFLVKLIGRHCEAVNIIVPSIESDLQELGVIGPLVSRIPNGVSVNHAVSRKKVNEIRVLTFTGRLTWQKGLDVLIASSNILKEEKMPFRCEIYGDGPEAERLAEMAERFGVSRQICFCGPKARKEIRNYLSQADVFVLPSRYEGMSNAVLEAMEVGMPIIATSCGGVDTYISEAIGWVCRPGDPDELADAMRKALTAPPDALLRMGVCARALIKEKFEIKSISQKNIDLMQLVVATHGSQ